MPSKQFVRQSFLGPDSEEILRACRVAIVGLCGGGSHIAQQLAHIGVGHLYLFDGDRADLSNNHRMVGLSRSAARRRAPKTDVIRRLVKSINPDVEIVLVPKTWQEDPTLLKECTAVFGCVDSYIARDELEHYTRRYLVPYIDVGMDVFGTAFDFTISGQIILSLPSEPCMRCFGFVNQERLTEEARRYGKAGGRPQVIWPNGTLASIAVGKFMSLVTPWHTALIPPLYTEYDGNRMIAYQSHRLEALGESPCRHYGGPGSLGDIQW